MPVSAPVPRVLRSQSRQIDIAAKPLKEKVANKVPDKAIKKALPGERKAEAESQEKLEVVCQRCGAQISLEMRYLARYKEGNWATKFMCYKIKLRKIYC